LTDLGFHPGLVRRPHREDRVDALGSALDRGAIIEASDCDLCPDRGQLSRRERTGEAGEGADAVAALEQLAGDRVGFANSGGLVFMDESAEQVAAA
jgi:hypothetical protein